MLERFIYMERMSDSLLDESQRKLLHVFPKEKITSPESETLIQPRIHDGNTAVQKLIDNMVEIEDHSNNISAKEFEEAYKQISHDPDNPVNSRILAIINKDLIEKGALVGKEEGPEGRPRLRLNAAGVVRQGTP